MKTYVEPFVGGANVIDKIKCDVRIGSDINEYLIELLLQVRDNVDVLPADFTCIWEKELGTNFDSNRKEKQTRIERLYKCNLS